MTRTRMYPAIARDALVAAPALYLLSPALCGLAIIVAIGVGLGGLVATLDD